MRALLASLCLLAATSAFAQSGPVLVVTVLDPSGALLVGAHVQAVADAGTPVDAYTGPDGMARIVLPPKGRVNLRVESAGFEPASLDGLAVRRDTRRTVTLRLAKVYETVQVGRDPRAQASDPRSDAFATILGAAEIRELPDDPDDMERVLKDMAGPGAVMRVNGFRGGRLPPKDQIAQIRFHRNLFGTDAHEPGFISVDIVTKPGLDTWHGSAGFGGRNALLDARNALAPARGDEGSLRGSSTASGPVWKKHTSLSLSADGTSAYDSQTLVGATLDGPFARSVRRPMDTANASLRLEHALTPTQQVRAEVQRSHAFNGNLGVGTFDLESRGYSQARDESLVRGSLVGGLRRSLYNEFRWSWRASETTSASHVQAPAVSVLGAFTAGGAQVDGSRTSRIVDLADDLDISRGHHAMRAGVLLSATDARSSEAHNTLGTFVFPDLAAFAAGQPTSFTRSVGNPVARLRETMIASYLQDDVRVSTRLTLSGGIRQERQSVIGGLHLGPRGGLAWSPFRSGHTTVRAGAGLFFDWFEPGDALRAIQLDGAHQRIETVLAPAYPGVADAVAATPLRNGRVQLAAHLAQPMLREASVAVEHARGPVRLSVTVRHGGGVRGLRGVDVNAPAAGVRPDPLAGPVTEIRSTARRGTDALSVNLNLVQPERHVFIAANYTLSRTVDETDSPFSLAADPMNPAAEHGPSLTDARHRAIGFASVPLGHGVTAGTAVALQSALPYDITTGRDDNGDGLNSDRPVGTGRNAGRGRASADLSARLAWRRGFGGPAPAGPSGPQVRLVRAGGDANPLADMPGGTNTRRFGLELYAQVFNALNHTNGQAYGGVQASPYFGHLVAAGPPRRMEVGARLTL